MQIFSHINELRLDGWTGLRTCVLAFEKTILWAPSASLLLKYSDENSLLVSPEELIWYIKKGHIQIMARDWWLENGEERRNHSFEGARWIEDFDGQLLDWWKEDQREGRSKNTSRVIAFKKATGREWAVDQISSGNIDVDSIVSGAEKSLPVYKERIEKISDKKGKAISLLENARNHGQAFGWSRADRNLGSPEDAELLKILTKAAHDSGSFTKSVYPYDDDVSNLFSGISELLEKIQRSEKPSESREESFDRTKMLLNDEKELTWFRDFVVGSERIATMVDPDRIEDEISAILRKDIKRGTRQTELRDILLPKGLIEFSAPVFSLVMAAISYATGTPDLPITLIPIAIPPVGKFLQRVGLLKEDYHGPKWPFYLAEGSGDVKRKRRENMLALLKK